MMLISTLAAVAAVVTAQDGGVRLESAQQQPAAQAPAQAAAVPGSNTADAGTPVTRVEKVMVPGPDHSAELAKLQAQLEAQTTKLDAAVQELEAVRGELKAKNDADQRQAATVEAQRSAAVTLGSVDQALSTGNTNVEGQLTAVEGSLGPAARENLARARDALSNSDLPTARFFLSRAAADAQAGR